MFCGLEIELAKGQSGLRMYLNVYSLEVPQEEPGTGSTFVEILRGNESCSFYASIFSGGQRMLLPSEGMDYIISSLLCQEPLSITVGKYHTEIKPLDFVKKYKLLMKDY